MELPVFLIRPHQSTLKILSWNINGVRTKLEKPNVENLFLKYDIISLNEIKTDLCVSLPGYVGFKSVKMNSAHRGGTIVLVKSYLSSHVICVDNNTEEQVWLQLRCVPQVTFGFCYIPPSDSPYYSYYSFAALQEKLSDDKSRKITFGVTVSDLFSRVEAPECSLTQPFLMT